MCCFRFARFFSQELSDVASREFSFEKMLDKMQTDWEGLTLELGPWKETGTHILKGGPIDEAQVRQPATRPFAYSIGSNALCSSSVREVESE